jgi:hypothetical protein
MQTLLLAGALAIAGHRPQLKVAIDTDGRRESGPAAAL